MFFRHSKNVGQEEFRVPMRNWTLDIQICSPMSHRDSNVRRSEVRILLWTRTVFFVPRSWTRRKTPSFFFCRCILLCIHRPTLFVKHVSQTLSSFFSLYQELRFFSSQVWQEQIYKDNMKEVGAILNKIGSQWFFSTPSNLASPEKILPANVTISVAKISMFWPSLFFFLFSTIYTVFFKLSPRQKKKRKLIFTDNNVERWISLFKWLWIHENHRYWMLIKK